MFARSHPCTRLSSWLAAGILACHTQQWAAAQVLTNAAQIRALTAEQTARHLPVRLRGVFLGQNASAEMGFVIADHGEDIYLQGPLAMTSEFSRGDVVEAEGVTDPGGFAPFVQCASVRRVGRGEVPPPRQVSLGDLSNGSLDAQWVEVRGVVRSCEPMPASGRPMPPPGTIIPSNAVARWNERKFKMTLAWGTERLAVQVNDELRPEAYVDAEVRLRGICFSRHNASRQFLNPLLLVPRGVELVVEKPPESDPFQIPLRPVASLLQFDRQEKFGHRVHVRGVVTHHRPGQALWLRDGASGLRVESTQNDPLPVGDVVDVVGFPVSGQYTPALEDAVYRTETRVAPPPPIEMTNLLGLFKHDADLVQFQATLLECRSIGEGYILTLDLNGLRIEASVQLPNSGSAPPEWLPNSQVRVAGICSVVTTEHGPVSGIWEPKSFRLLLRSRADLTVLRAPSWWTYPHIMLLLGVVAGASVGAVGGVMWFARRRLREQDSRRAMAEAEFAAILSERNRMAREIHDTLAQGLVATSVQLRLAKKQLGQNSGGVGQYLDAAQQLVRESLEEARNSIWNMRSHVLESNDLAGALTGILKQLSEGTGIQATIAVTGKARRLAPVVENNLLRVGQEAITNAARHAHASRIAVTLDFADEQFRLVVSDDGRGFNSAQPPPGDGGFGLVGIRERAAQLKGDLNIRSAPGDGTEIRLSVPLSAD
jgi:signal transduction histidine kinase